MKAINARLRPLGSEQRKSIPLIELITQAKYDCSNNLVTIRGVQYELDTIEWEVVNVNEN